MATWSQDPCRVSPDKQHEPDVSEIEVTRPGGRVDIMLATVCRWCGKQLAKPKKKRR